MNQARHDVNSEHGHDDSHDSGGCCGHGHSPEGVGAVTLSLAVSGLLTGVALAGHAMNWLPGGAVASAGIAAMLSGGWFLLPKAWAAMRRLRPDINLLVVLAAIGASVIGEWVEASAVVFLFGVAEWLESWAERRARRATAALLELAPKTALVRRDGRFVETPADQVAVGEIVAVRSGMGIPLDGEVVSGESAVNQASITGESAPVDKKPGDTVFAGTLNGEGALEINVTKASGDTTLARIIRLVEEAQEQKAPTQRFVDMFARRYTPLVALAALAVFLVPPLLLGGAWAAWLYRACVLLIIACPCALVIATPVGIVAGLTALARRGVLVKGGAHLETIARLKALAVDKTGTITEGKPAVRTVDRIAAGDDGEILRVAAALDDHSAHPLAKAVVACAKERGIAFPRAGNYQNRAGRGAEGVVDGRACFVGNHRFAHELGVCTEELERRLAAIEDQGLSVVVVGHRPPADARGGMLGLPTVGDTLHPMERGRPARSEPVLGLLAIGDTLRPRARQAITDLRAAGVNRIVMLSGDNQRTAARIARQAGIDEAHGDLLPDDKVAAVRTLRARHGIVAMVGDGVNDAPAMAAANVGIAMGAAGADAAIETADIALMQDELGEIAKTLRLGRRTLSIIHFNITFALTLKALFLALTLLGCASLWLAILADTGATLLVVANALRLLRVPVKITHAKTRKGQRSLL
ncbi:MAG: cadmium-translocating P-type ATPase [Opitutaceae bacterium]|jgi:Cd2+/Zn2+-exporting ATPase|nr:cadmium-translocating P-type ATPase [Opitutaceae bacterium]